MRVLAAIAVSLVLATNLMGCASDDSAGPIASGGSSGFAGHAGVAGSNTAGQAQGGAAGATQGAAGSAGASAGAAGSDTAGSAGTGGNGGASQAGSGGSAGTAGAAQAGSGGTAGTAGAAQAGNGGTAGVGGAPVTVPNDPTALTLQVVDGTSIALGWTDNADNETGYDVYWSTTADKPAQPNTQLAANASSFTATGLTTHQAYTFWVDAYNSTGKSNAITGSATPAPVPAAPTGLVVAGSATQIVLTWVNNATDDTGYRVYYATSNTQPTTAQHEIAADSATYTIPAAELTAYTTYYFWVQAYNAVGNSVAVTGTGAMGTAPSAPTGVTVDDTTSPYVVDAKWTDGGSNSTGFNVYWSMDDTQPSTPNTTVAAGVTEYKLTQVFGAQTYRFWVEATNSIGKSSASKGTAAAPTLDLKWNELWLDDASSVHLALKDSLGGIDGGDAATVLYAYHSASPTAMGTGSVINPYVIWNTATSNIDTTTTHYFWTEARTSAGSLFSVRTMSPAGAVTNLNAAPTNLDAALTWATTAGAAAYQVYWGTSTFNTAVPTGYATSTSSTVVGLNPGTQYSFWVRAVSVAINNGGGQYGFPGPVATVSNTTTGAALGANLAKGKTAVASSGDAPNNVTDGNYSTRWQAATINPGEWVYVDLGSSANITHVKLVWEAAYATDFDVQVCPASCAGGGAASTWPWQALYSANRTLTGNFPYFELLPVTTPTTGQFVRVRANALALPYGVSLYELEVYSAP